jgi:hypothetical protein
MATKWIAQTFFPISINTNITHQGDPMPEHKFKPSNYKPEEKITLNRQAILDLYSAAERFPDVDTYDITGARVAANVTLTSTGSSIAFYTSNILATAPAITVTTSASATTTVNAAVVSAGVSTITTTVTL